MLSDRGRPYAPGVPPAALYPPHRRSPRDSSEDGFERWERLDEPLAWRDLVGACDDLLEALGLRGGLKRIDSAPPDAAAEEAGSDCEAEQVEVCFWRAQKIELAVQRMEYSWRDPEGKEAVGVELLAELGPLTRGARLRLIGTQGRIGAFLIDGAWGSSRERLVQCWVDVVERSVRATAR